MLGQKWDIWSTLLPPHLRAQGQRWRILQLKCLLNMTGPTQNYSGLPNSCGGLYTNCTKKLSMSTSQHGRERAHMLPPPAEDQWKADSCQKRRLFSLGVCSLCSRELPGTHLYSGSKNKNKNPKKLDSMDYLKTERKRTLAGSWLGRGSGSWWGGLEDCIQNEIFME